MAPLVKAFQEKKDDFKTVVCVTVPHREMPNQVLDVFGIKPGFDLESCVRARPLRCNLSRVDRHEGRVRGLSAGLPFRAWGYDNQHGGGSCRAFYRQIPVCHVEAGLRTHDIYSPCPEEMNRRITGRIATYDFAPTP